jgi:hypothetical protein
VLIPTDLLREWLRDRAKVRERRLDELEAEFSARIAQGTLNRCWYFRMNVCTIRPWLSGARRGPSAGGGRVPAGRPSWKIGGCSQSR